MVSSTPQIALIVLFVLFYFPLACYGQGTRRSDVLNYLSNQSLFLHFSRFRGQSVPSKEVRAFLDRQARWDAAGQSDPNTSGSRLRFVKIDEQVKPGGHGTARYRVFAEGAPENKVYSIGIWPIANTLAYDPRDLYVNGQGLLMLHKPTPEQEFSFKAEADEFDVTAVTDSAVPTRYLLSSRDRQLLIYGTLVPNPVVAEEQTCRLEARIAQPDATAVLIIVDRFPAKARIPLVLESEVKEPRKI